MTSFIDDLKTLESPRWSFVKPNPPHLFESNLLKTLEDCNETVLHLVCSCQIDDTGNRFTQGFIQTSQPVTMDALNELLGPIISNPCSTIDHQESSLTENHMNDHVFEFGDAKAVSNFEAKKEKIVAFKECADAVFTEAVNEIERKHWISS